MTTQTLPPISPGLQAAIRAYGLANGWKNAARALAYGPVYHATTEGVTPKARRNGHKRCFTLAWWQDGRINEDTYTASKEATAWGLARERAHEIDGSRFEREIPYPFTPPRPRSGKALDETDVRLAQYEERHCCGQRMGVIERWDVTGAKGLYQCAENPKHQQPAEAT
jgi:hypothetical protein